MAKKIIEKDRLSYEVSKAIQANMSYGKYKGLQHERTLNLLQKENEMAAKILTRTCTKDEFRDNRREKRGCEKTKFYWFTFADGYRELARGYDRIEMNHMVANHGKLREKELA